MMKKNAVVITGAAGGIGRCLVDQFEAAGYVVIATDLAPQPADGLMSRYEQCDLSQLVTDSSYADEVFTRLRRALGSLNLKALINNAAVQLLGRVDEISRQDWAISLNVNLIAPFLLTQALLGELESAGGCVINISSIHARLTKPNFLVYATTKAALSGMTRALSVDLEARVRVNAIEPAAIQTPMLTNGFAGDQGVIAKLGNCHPQKRLGTPEEIASLALLIASDGTQFLHGACIPMDGGIGARLFDPT
jgi:NAD(P)-dependent dehydrogenase (short-subunit alcohol dehydrogenase family)